jgi:hypothetical protein
MRTHRPRARIDAKRPFGTAANYGAPEKTERHLNNLFLIAVLNDIVNDDTREREVAKRSVVPPPPEWAHTRHVSNDSCTKTNAANQGPRLKFSLGL